MLLKIDAVFEGALGFVLLLAAATGTLGSSDFPTPVGQVVLLVVGCALLMLCGLISSGRIGLRALALGNGVTALAGLAWLFGAAGWSNAGAALVAVTIAVLVLLAAAQAATLRA